MTENTIKDLAFSLLVLLAVLFFRDIPLEFQGIAGAIYGMLIVFTRIKNK
ncbi:hypothetical protein [Clostridium frigidicarnis]|uniref:Uncharacterized protein n=1 Tax=Clostridium frigidicarnis TaxID=84698 RepID=A0A1I0V2H7_9CLOT|nr:hypothetical protein [Clostridium frigidicarnis]SFA70528.1 hypothetical protein SAMN04488528_1001114 [Clostridium frigidicarnis]